ncbi:leucine-rich repeat domain-containing protein [Mucilaginibacter celer]|uniref:Leucine-rich repeat domain-containing protein n=1 Tax=Mucilaginibacter celer TaxID=2305508 RepID=A0A494W206_9SPHI|nr:WG repeat-containing protein [Mucilaginibacter celer]AYL97793.1 hypothetical protein HYN43_021950 [Mucilaginibacter celer]
MKQYPFKFLRPYNKNEVAFFSGRDEEIARLYEMVFQSPVLLVYGASGTGKTSLIQCGLASKFAAHDWMDLPVRRGKDINQSLQKVLTDAGGQKNTSVTEPDWLSNFREKHTPASIEEADSGVTGAIKNIYLNCFKPLYLIFDQFEELYILGSKEEQTKFIRTVQQILLVEQPVKMIFSIREEFLGYLDEFERAVPQLTRKKLRVEPMNDAKVKQVIESATCAETSLVTIKPGEEAKVAKAIFEKLKITERAKTIQLPYLHVFLDRFYMAATGDESRETEVVFDLEKLNSQGKIGDILQKFLEEQVARISEKMLPDYSDFTQEMIWSIMSPFATLEGTKEPISKSNLYGRFPNCKPASIEIVIKEFDNSRIIRYDEDTDMYELMHDSLAKRIAEKRSKKEKDLLEAKSILKFKAARSNGMGEALSESDLFFIEPLLKDLKLSDTEIRLFTESKDAVQQQRKSEELRLRKYNNRLRMMLLASVVSCFVACFLGYEAYQAEKQARAVAKKNASLYQKAKISQENTKKLIASVYFYRDKIGLSKVEKNGKLLYGFINKDLKLVIPYKYTEAETFDDTGFAKVKRNGKQYLVDVEGNEYLASTSVDSLTDNTEALFLSDQDFKTFPEQIFDHANLKVLILSDCNLYELPPDIKKLTNLKLLDLAQNYFSKIPSAVLKLNNLVSLNISGNDLTEIPKDIDQLQKLRELQLYWNDKLKKLPPDLSNIKSLRWLDVSGTGVKETDTGIKTLLAANPKCKIIWKGNQAY